MDVEKKHKPLYVGLAPDIDLLEKLAPDAPKEVQQLLLQLKTRNAEIESWFQADPERLALLQRDPQRVLSELLNTMKLERPTPVKPVDLGQWDIAFKPKPVPLGSSLLSAVWQHVCSSPQNTQDFIRDPFNVIGVVASNTSATIQERGSVIRAFETVLGIYHIEVNALGTLRLFSGRVPS